MAQDPKAILEQAQRSLAERNVEETVQSALKAREASKGRHDKDGEAEALDVLAQANLLKADFDEALRIAQERRELYQALSNTEKELAALRQIVDVYLAGDRAAEATHSAREASLLCQAFGSKTMEAVFLGQIADAYLLKDKNRAAFSLYSDAVRVAREALDIFEEINEAESVDAANVKTAAAKAYLLRREPLQCLRFAGEAAAVYQKEGKAQRRGCALRLVADAHLLQNDVDQALTAAQGAAAAFREAGDETNLRESLRMVTSAQNASRPREQQPRSGQAMLMAGQAEPGFSYSDHAYETGPKAPANCELGGERKVYKGNRQSAPTEAWNIPRNPKYTLNVDCNSADAIKSTLTSMPRETIIWSQGLVDGACMAWNVDLCMLLIAMASAQLRTPIIVLTRGCHSRDMGELTAHAPLSCISGNSLWGMIRTARQELPNIPISTVDVSAQYSMAEIGYCIAAPQCFGPMTGESSYYWDTKFTPYIDSVPSLFKDAKRDTGPNVTGAVNPNFGKQGEKKPTFPKRQSFGWRSSDHKLDNAFFAGRWRAEGSCVPVEQ